MKKLLLTFLIPASLGFWPKSDQNIPQYIEIKHVGIEQKLIKPLFISTKSLDIEAKGANATINNQKIDHLTLREKIILANGDYSTLIIDERTFKTLLTFIHQYSHFSKDPRDKKLVNYSIVFKDENYNITYRQTHAFFSDLTKSLKAGNTDKNSANSLVSYFDENFY